jgi:hypothetical protein
MEKFKDTEIGRIPEEWEQTIFSEVVDINPKRELKKSRQAKSVSMSNLSPFLRKVSNYAVRHYWK